MTDLNTIEIEAVNGGLSPFRPLLDPNGPKPTVCPPPPPSDLVEP